MILNEDCLSGIKKLPSSSVDLIILDPPYGGVVKEKWDARHPLTKYFIEDLYRVLKETGSIYIWCGIGEKSQSLIEFFNLFKESDFFFKDLITWKKQKGIGMRKGWLYTREECLWYVKNNKKFVWNKENQYLETHTGSNISKAYMEKTGHGARITNVWTDITEPSMRGNKKLKQVTGHITPKPTEAIDRIISLHTNEGDVVLDPFMGSGTTAVSSVNLNRNYIGFELSEEYIDIANNRLV